MKVEVANGEIADKFTIIKIKLKHAKSDEAILFLNKEYNYLAELVETLNVPQNLIEDLETINQKIWDIEDSIRVMESEKRFDDNFIQVARSVYFNNDERFRIKNEINKVTNSFFQEQKVLPQYD